LYNIILHVILENRKTYPERLHMNSLNIVLHEPEIPQNTGNIARTCAAVGASLHLIKPLGFRVDDKKLKRAGLDYWHALDITYYEGLEDFFARNPVSHTYLFSTKADIVYTDVTYPDPVFLMFGKETAGLPEELLRASHGRCVRLPMREGLRSLNLSNCVAVAVYEVLRQRGFCGLQKPGSRPGFHGKMSPAANKKSVNCK
jgi:tRNA (cytidine/uridine-2'-O-)-methyltransferase